MTSIKTTLHIFVLLISILPMGAWPYCSPRYTSRPLNGFYCNGKMYRPPFAGIQASCVHACITSPSCSAMSYNPVTSTCLLNKQPCVKAQKHDHYMLMTFRHQENQDCVVWVRDKYGVVPDRMLTGPNNAHVGRVTVGNDLLVGLAGYPGQNLNTYIAHNGNQIYFRNEDLLTVHPNCTVAWVPYKAFL